MISTKDKTICPPDPNLNPSVPCEPIPPCELSKPDEIEKMTFMLPEVALGLCWE